MIEKPAAKPTAAIDARWPDSVVTGEVLFAVSQSCPSGVYGMLKRTCELDLCSTLDCIAGAEAAISTIARGYRRTARSPYDRGANRGGLLVIADISRRRLGRVARLSVCSLALAVPSDAAGAAPFDFLFGGPPPTARVLRRRPALRRPMADIPLPPPRPHFPGDAPAPAVASGTPKDEAPKDQVPKDQGHAETPRTPAAPPQLPSKPASPPDTSKPAETAQAPTVTTKPVSPEAADGSPPLPPPKPADLEKGAPPPAGPDATKPSDTAKPSGPAKPVSAAPPPAAAPPAPGAALPAQPPTPPPKPADVGQPPTVAPSGATTAFTPRSPEDNPQCPSELAARHVDATPTALGPQPDARCTVVEPVRLAEMTLADGAKVAFPDHPTIACTTADSFTAYVRDLLVPLAKGTFGSPITAVWTGPGLECRSRDSVFGAKLSAHGQGLAIDIAQLKLADGRLIEVGTPKTDAETGFETAARAGACGYFHTVLGPGSDAYHRTHWHFDLEVRGAHGDSKYCK